MRLRLRTVLIGTAVLSPVVAGVAVVARHGGLANFQAEQAWLALSAPQLAESFRRSAEESRERGASPEETDWYRARERESRLKADWARLLSGGRPPEYRMIEAYERDRDGSRVPLGIWIFHLHEAPSSEFPTSGNARFHQTLDRMKARKAEFKVFAARGFQPDGAPIF